jgi:hypothetical protein
MASGLRPLVAAAARIMPKSPVSRVSTVSARSR